MPLSFIEIKYGSDAYVQMTELRRKILRRPLGLDFTEEELSKEQEDCFLCVFDKNELIACCILSNPLDDNIKLRQMAVEQQAQKKGIGAALLSFAEEMAVGKGFRSIRLNARLTAMNFYEKYGYDASGNVFDEVGIPHIEMRKELI